MSFAPVKRLRLAEQVASTIRDAILGGDYVPGDSLPSERDLADQFGVNRSSVREALHRLEASGLVEMRHGGATRVRAFLITAGLQLLPYLLAPGGQLDPKWLGDLLEMRTMLLGWTARRACLRATPAAIAALEAILARLDAADIPAVVRQADYDFFDALVAMTGNDVLGLFSAATRQVFEQHVALFDAVLDGFDTAHHRATVAAIRAGDAAGAAAAMTAYGAVAEAQIEGLT